MLLMAACKPGTPGKYIQPDDMEDILVDYHLARAMADDAMSNDNQERYVHGLYLEVVLRKHGVTREEFDSSLVYYYTRADRFNDIYKRVAERLEEQALVMGASESEIGKYVSLDANGDTANVWSDRPNIMMMPVPPYNRRSFEVMVDTTFRQGDSFLFLFMSEYLYQDGAKTSTAYLALHYTDTIITRYLRLQPTGLNRLRIPAHDAELESIKGYFFVGEGTERTTTTRILFLNNIQFIRFHKEKKIEDENIKKDSLPSDSVAGRVVTDSISHRDSIGGSDEMVPADRGTGPHRMVVRDSEPLIRPAEHPESPPQRTDITITE